MATRKTLESFLEYLKTNKRARIEIDLKTRIKTIEEWDYTTTFSNFLLLLPNSYLRLKVNLSNSLEGLLSTDNDYDIVLRIERVHILEEDHDSVCVEDFVYTRASRVLEKWVKIVNKYAPLSFRASQKALWRMSKFKCHGADLDVYYIVKKVRYCLEVPKLNIYTEPQETTIPLFYITTGSYRYFPLTENMNMFVNSYLNYLKAYNGDDATHRKYWSIFVYYNRFNNEVGFIHFINRDMLKIFADSFRSLIEVVSDYENLTRHDISIIIKLLMLYNYPEEEFIYTIRKCKDILQLYNNLKDVVDIV